MTTETKILGVDLARTGSERMVLTCFKKREGESAFEITNSWPCLWGMVPEGCLEIGWAEEKEDKEEA